MKSIEMVLWVGSDGQVIGAERERFADHEYKELKDEGRILAEPIIRTPTLDPVRLLALRKVRESMIRVYDLNQEILDLDKVGKEHVEAVDKLTSMCEDNPIMKSLLQSHAASLALLMQASMVICAGMDQINERVSQLPSGRPIPSGPSEN